MNRNVLLASLLLFTLIPGLETYAYTAEDYTNAGLQVYAKKDYGLAVRYFTAALAVNPSNVRALQSRANSYYFLGKNQEALADYEKVLANNPSGPVSQFVQALRAKAGSAGPALGTSAPASTGPVSAGQTPSSPAGIGTAAVQKPGGIGFRLEPGMAFITLNDFLSDGATRQADAAVSQLTDPTYTFKEAVPSGFIDVCLEPLVQVGPNFEIGLPFSIMPVGNVSSPSSGTSGYADTISYSISGFSVGLNGRFILGSGPLRIFAAGGGLLVPVGISYSDILNVLNNTTQISGNFSSLSFGGQAQLGFDFHVGEPFVVSLFGGYQSASANGFKGSVATSVNGTTTTDPGQLGVFDDTNGKKVTFLKDGNAAPLNFRPLQIDLSGVLAGIHLAIFF